jgi:fatty acid desaturase
MPSYDIAASPLPKVEWPTLALLLLCSGLFVGLSLFGNLLPLWLAIALLTVTVAQHSSLQHEVLHGHPFRNDTLNEALVFVPIGLWLPYRRFRDSHIAHHRDTRLTDPYDDPETNYLDPKIWQHFGPVTKAVLLANNTLAGRMLIGPLIGMYSFYKGDMKEIRRGNKLVRTAYLLHLLALVPLFWWLITYAVLPLWAYVLAAYGGTSLLKIRTYLEHRAHNNVPARTVIIESRGFFALLFLNNNFHAVHHQFPDLPWYLIPQFYAADKARFQQQNEGYIYKSYTSIFRHYLFHRKDDIPHPLYPPKSDNP